MNIGGAFYSFYLFSQQSLSKVDSVVPLKSIAPSLISEIIPAHLARLSFRYREIMEESQTEIS